MILKLLEIRDSATFIPVAAMSTNCAGTDEAETWLLRRSGFAFDSHCVFVMKLQTGGGEYDPYSWPGGSRTMQVAHLHIEKHWAELKSGDVVDVEFLLGMTTKPKTSERLDE